jgi:hypothetical protein
MTVEITNEHKHFLSRLADEPFYKLRKLIPEDSEDAFFDLLDRLKASWQEARRTRINLCFVLDLDPTPSPLTGQYDITQVEALQKKQNAANSTLVFVIDVQGNVISEQDLGGEIEPQSVTQLSVMLKAIVFWLGADFDIIAQGVLWVPRNKSQVLKEIKSKHRDLLKMDDHRLVLTTHYEQYIRRQGIGFYWFPSKENEVLQPKPERIFQKSLYDFLRREVDCIPEREAMFKDQSRCDIRVLVDDYDLYFIEIKWIGFCAVAEKNRPIVSAIDPAESTVESAIAGACQTRIYIEENNASGYDLRVKLGVLVVYNAYPTPGAAISYPKEIDEYPLLDTMEFQLVVESPSLRGKKMARKMMKDQKQITSKKASSRKPRAKN